MRIEHAFHSAIGGRPINEDSVFCKENCYVVADGLGGHGNGELASAAAAEFIGKGYCGSCTDEELERLLCGADGAVHQKGSGGKSTAAVVICSESVIRYANIGDSRVYYFRQGRIMERTRDHSVCQAAVDMGEMTAAQVRESEDRTGLFKVLGAETPLKLPKPYAPIDFQDGDAFLICSDGFWEYVYETEMEIDLLKSATAKQWLDHMVKRLLLRSEGKGDNYSAICGFVHAQERPAKAVKKRSITPALIGIIAAGVVVLGGAFGAVKLVGNRGGIAESSTEESSDKSADFIVLETFEMPADETNAVSTEQSGEESGEASYEESNSENEDILAAATTATTATTTTTNKTPVEEPKTTDTTSAETTPKDDDKKPQESDKPNPADTTASTPKESVPELETEESADTDEESFEQVESEDSLESVDMAESFETDDNGENTEEEPEKTHNPNTSDYSEPIHTNPSSGMEIQGAR